MTRRRSTPTRPTAGSSPAPSTTTSTGIAATWIDHHDTGRSIAVVASTNDHVDTINHAIQTARLAAGHLDPDVATRIAAGETAYVGDVVATRRNDRRLITSSGEPVRNRDTWTVTAINHDGSITVSHQGGHGDVTLPADYVREHVRLGYAATEHGWQSDTVDTAIALTSPATTRRGLYVAATRGRDDNILCVVTDSDDIAEARDVLEADPRRRPRRHPRHHPTPHPRPVDATTSHASSADADAALRDPGLVPDRPRRRPTRPPRRRDPRGAAVSAASRGDRRRSHADAVLAEVAAATAADRDALHHAEARAVDARRRHAAAATSARHRPPPPTPHAPPRPPHRRAPTRTGRGLPRTHPPTNRAPPSNATPRPSPTSATPTSSSGPATPSTASTP